MNPLTIIMLLSLISNKNGAVSKSSTRTSTLSIGNPPVFDTFKMELLLDRLHQTVDTLERVNRVSQIAREPMNKSKGPELLDAIGAPPQIKQISELAQNFKLPDKGQASETQSMPDMSQLIQNIGPILQMLSAGK